MSKVQKALKRIRDSRARASGAGNGGEQESRRDRNGQSVESSVESSVNMAREHAGGTNGHAVVPDETPPEQPIRTAPPPRPAPIGGPEETASLPTIDMPDQVLEIDRESLLEAGLLTSLSPDPAGASSYRRIKRPIIANAFARRGDEAECANVVMLTSAMPGAGKSFCSYGLAVSIAQERDIGAVLIDADVLRPTITRAFGLEAYPGLTDFLSEDRDNIEDVILQTDIDDIVVMPAGSLRENATELLASRRMKRLVKTLSRAFADRIVIVDTPPMLITTEAQVLADHVGQVVLVVEAGVTAHADVLEVLEVLDRGKPVNAILNKSRNVSAQQYGSGYYGYTPSPKSEGSHENQT